MENEVLKAIEDKFAEMKKSITDGSVSYAKYTEDMDSLKSELGKLDNAQAIADIKGTIEQLSKDFASLKESRTTGISFVDDFKQASEVLMKNIEQGKFHERVQIKTVGDMLISTNVTGNNTQPVMLTNMAEVRLAVPRAFEQCNVFQTTEGKIVDVSMSSEEGGAAATAEGSAKNQYDYNIAGVNYDTTAVNAYITVSRQMLKNFGYLQNQMQNRLMVKVLDKMSSYVYEGNGSAPIWKGINQTGFHQDWAAGSYANAYAAPTILHALIIGVGQVRTSHFEPTYININPADYAGLWLAIIEKQISLPQLVVSGNLMTLSGVPVVPNSHITSDAFQIGDYKLSNLALQGAYEMFIDPYSGLKNNKITILGEQMGIHFVQAADANAFVQGDISTAITALTAS